jgi:glucan 1,3-beta-glucosidase
MREGALPSPANQARVIAEILARGKREGFRVNVIEAFDQPWKRYLEGTVGGHWGLLDDATRAQKFSWGEPVSNHPHWRWQAAGGVALALAMFAVAMMARRREWTSVTFPAWIAIALNATVSGVLIGWTIETLPVESLGFGGWLRSLSFATLAIACPLAGSAALAIPQASPAFAQVVAPRVDRTSDPLAFWLGFLLLAVTVLALQSALALAFDPRYRDFPFAPLTSAALPFLLLSLLAPLPPGQRSFAETVAAAVLVLCSLFIVWNETMANWQALWFCSMLGLLAISLLRARAAPG